MVDEIIKKEYEKYLNMVLEIDSKKRASMNDIFQSKLLVTRFDELEMAHIFDDRPFSHPFSDGYILVKVGKDKYNFMSFEEYRKNGFRGKCISKINFDFAGDFEGDYAKVERSDEWNYIDKKGNLISDTWYYSVHPFKDGLAIVRKSYSPILENYMKEDGTLLLDTWYQKVWPFQDGYAIVENGGSYNFIDRNGNLVSEKWYTIVSKFHCGFAQVRGANLMWNFIDQNGKLISETWYHEIGEFSEGLAQVRTGVYWNYINEKGEKLLKEGCPQADKFRGGYAVILRDIPGRGKDMLTIINKKGEKVFEADYYDEMESASGKRFRVKKNSTCNFIDEHGTLISKIWFDDASLFFNGFALVRRAQKWNYIDLNGNLISDIWFDGVENFQDGVARVSRKKNSYEKEWNVINEQGNLLSEDWFTVVYPFIDGYAKVQKGFGYNFMDKQGNLFLKQYTDEPGNFKDGYFLIQQDGKYNMIDQTGEPLFDWQIRLDFFYGDYAIVKRNGEYNYINKKGEYVLKDWITNIKVLENGYRLEQDENTLYLLDGNRNYLYQAHLPKDFVYAVKFLRELSWSEITINPTTVEKTMFGYKLHGISLKYEPVREFEYFVLCKKNDRYFLYDKRSKDYQSLCDESDLVHGENYITYQGRTFFFSDVITEVTGILPQTSIQLKPGVNEVLPMEEFQKKYISKDFYEQLRKKLLEEKERLRKERLENEEKLSQEEIEARRQELEEILKNEEVEGKVKKEMLEKQMLYYLKLYAEAAQQLAAFEQDDSFKTVKKTESITEEVLFEWVEDHKEIRKEYLTCNILRHYDLAYISFDNVKISGIDLSYTNAEINPQTVYGKDMSNGNYSGLNFTLKDFTGVSIQNSVFEDCIFDFANQKKRAIQIPKNLL